MKRERPFEDQIGPRERVRVADRPEADIFGGPRAEPVRFEQCFSKYQRILRFGKRNSPAQHAPAEFSYSFPARSGCFHRPEIGICQYFRPGKQARFLSR